MCPSTQGRGQFRINGTGLPARSTLEPPQRKYIPNPHRPSNPFSATDQADWIKNPYPDPSSDSGSDMKHPGRSQSTRRKGAPAPLPPPARRSRAATDMRHSKIDGGGGGGSTAASAATGSTSTSPPRSGPAMTSIGLRAAGTGTGGVVTAGSNTSNTTNTMIPTTGLISPLSTSLPSPPLSKPVPLTSNTKTMLPSASTSTAVTNNNDGVGDDDDDPWSIRRTNPDGGKGGGGSKKMGNAPPSSTAAAAVPGDIKRKPAPPSVPKKPAVLRSPTGSLSPQTGSALGNIVADRRSKNVPGPNHNGVYDGDDDDGGGGARRDGGGKSKESKDRDYQHDQGQSHGLVDQHHGEEMKKLDGRWEALL